MLKVRRAVLSCYNKAGLVEFAQLLRELDVEIVSTAGTRRVLNDAGIEAIETGDFTGVEEMLDGRVKSLHPKIHSGLLGIRDNKVHVEQMHAHDYPWIDLVVVNLHPLDEVINRPGITVDEVVEQIDIGGASMVRSAAKNFRYVAVVVDPERYPAVMHELRAHEGEIRFPTRYRLAQEAFACIADYDRLISEYLRSAEPSEE